MAGPDNELIRQLQAQQPQHPQSPSQEAMEAVKALVGGGVPGSGLTSAAKDTPIEQVDVEGVRQALLAAMSKMARDATMAHAAPGADVLAKAALQFAQTYLLIDPTVDQAGVPVGAEAQAQGAAQVAAATAQGEQARQTQLHAGRLEAHARVHEQGGAYRPVDQNGHVEPPRIQPNPAEETLAARQKSHGQELRGAHGQKPTPKPRPGS